MGGAVEGIIFFMLRVLFSGPKWPQRPILFTGPSMVLCQCAVTNPGGGAAFSNSLIKRGLETL